MAAMAGYPKPPIPNAFSSSDWAPASVHSHLEKQACFRVKIPFKVVRIESADTKKKKQTDYTPNILWNEMDAETEIKYKNNVFWMFPTLYLQKSPKSIYSLLPASKILSAKPAGFSVSIT